jgi:hypothetical protein
MIDISKLLAPTDCTGAVDDKWAEINRVKLKILVKTQEIAFASSQRKFQKKRVKAQIADTKEQLEKYKLVNTASILIRDPGCFTVASAEKRLAAKKWLADNGNPTTFQDVWKISGLTIPDMANIEDQLKDLTCKLNELRRDDVWEQRFYSRHEFMVTKFTNRLVFYIVDADTFVVYNRRNISFLREDIEYIGAIKYEYINCDADHFLAIIVDYEAFDDKITSADVHKKLVKIINKILTEKKITIDNIEAHKLDKQMMFVVRDITLTNMEERKSVTNEIYDKLTKWGLPAHSFRFSNKEVEHLSPSHILCETLAHKEKYFTHNIFGTDAKLPSFTGPIIYHIVANGAVNINSIVSQGNTTITKKKKSTIDESLDAINEARAANEEWCRVGVTQTVQDMADIISKKLNKTISAIAVGKALNKCDFATKMPKSATKPTAWSFH